LSWFAWRIGLTAQALNAYADRLDQGVRMMSASTTAQAN